MTEALVKLQVSNLGSPDFGDKLSQLMLKANKEILDEAGAFLLNRIRTRFLAEVDPENNPWEQSHAAKIRRAGGYTWSNGGKWTGTGTLFASGRLFHSIQVGLEGHTDEGGGERVIATDVPYAPFLGKWPFMGVNDDDMGTLTSLLQLRLSSLFEEAL